MRRAVFVWMLTAILAASGGWAQPPAAGENLGELLAAFDRDLQKLLAEYRSASEAEKALVLDRAMKLAPEYSQRVMRVVDAHPADAEAVRGLVWIATVSMRRNLPPPPQAEPAFDRLVREHLGRPEISGLFPLLEIRPDGESVLRRIRELNADAQVRALAAFSLGSVLADDERQPTPARLREAEQLFSRGIDEARNVRGFPADRLHNAEGSLFEVRFLSVGKKAPEFEGTNLAGKPARLSDFNGKVVVLDFWTTNCVPCRAMIPHERQMTQRFSGKPFAIISVSADPDKELLTSFLKTESMPWTHWWVGEKSPVLDRWNVRMFPTIYVIDARGTIRYKNVRDKKLDEAVETLVKEAEASR